MKKMILSVATAVFLAVCLSSAHGATGYTILHSFAGQTANEGSFPFGALVSGGSTLYGTTAYGGSQGYGTVFSLQTDGSGYTQIYDFFTQTGDARTPIGNLILQGSTLYGVTQESGPNGEGTVFALKTDGFGYIDLHAFTAFTGDGAEPGFGLLADGSTLYGVTRYGGEAGDGTVFSLGTDGAAYTIRHNFPDSSSDGSRPFTPPTMVGGRLFGVTPLCANPSSSGVIYSMEPDGGDHTVIHQFVQQTEGVYPIGGLYSDGSRLYGTTGYGGSSDEGTIFSVNTDGSDYAVLHDFAVFTEDGAFPVMALVSDGSRLYGCTYHGIDGWSGGVLFAINKDGTGYTILHDFGSQTGDGSLLGAVLLLQDNVLYGSSAEGGEYGYGTIFSYTLPSPTPTPTYMVLADGDYNGDGLSDIAVFRPEIGLWAVRGLGRTYFGRTGDIPVSGDYNGDGVSDVAIFRPATGLWAIKEVSRVYFGNSSQIPVPGDYDGDGLCDPAVMDGSSGLWAIRGVTRVYYGRGEDYPIPADYRGDGVTAPAIFRPSSGLWAVRGLTRAYFGRAGDTPVPGVYRWYPSGKAAFSFLAEIAVFRPSTGLWAVRGYSRYYFGRAGDYPVRGDFTGNSLDDTGVFRPSNGLWAIRGITRAYFGAESDLPVTR